MSFFATDQANFAWLKKAFLLIFQPTEIEKYAQENLNMHKKGILGKKVPVENMLTWSKVSG